MAKPITLDTELLLLFEVGTTHVGYIDQHKQLIRLNFSSKDFIRLVSLIRLASDLVLLFHTLAEMSNWLDRIRDPARSKLYMNLRALVAQRSEVTVPGRSVVNEREFVRMGFTDAALVALARTGVTVLTPDGFLCHAIAQAGFEAVHFLPEFADP